MFINKGVLENVQSIRLTNTVMSKVKEKVHTMEPIQLSRLMKWVGRANIRDQKLLQFILEKCKNKMSKMEPRHCSWIMWGFCTVKYEMDYEFIDDMAHIIISDLKQNNLHDMSRNMVSFAKTRYKDEAVIDAIANYIINYKDVKADFPGISFISWAFASLSTKYVDIMRWADRNSRGTLNDTKPISISNLLWAFRKSS